MNKLVSWIKANKLSTVLVLTVSFLILRNSPIRNNLNFQKNDGVFTQSFDTAESLGTPTSSALAQRSILPPIPQPETPPSNSPDRLVITDTNLSILVNDVADTISKIQASAQSQGGFLVNSSVSLPEGASSGSITIRVPTDKREDALRAIKELGVRTVSENVSGRDVTDQFEDIQARLEVLNKTKTKFEQILDQAQEVQDLLQVQRELVNLQAQIDNLVGRQRFLEQSANLSKITVFLSTDELALPFTPDEVWRPSVIFKQSIRSLISTFRSTINGIIWLGVYAVIWIPALVIIWILFKKFGTSPPDKP